MKAAFRMIATLAIVISTCYESEGSVQLPPAISGVTSLPFGDFQVYSMVVLQSAFDGQPSNPNNVNTDPFYVDAATVTDLVILAQNNGFSNSSFPSADDPLTHDNPTFTGTWDAPVSELRSALLPGEQFVAWLNFSESQPGNSQPTEPDLLVWALVELLDTDTLQPALQFVLSSGSLSTTPPAVPANITDPTAFAYVHNLVTIGPDGTFLHVGGFLGGEPAGSQEVSQQNGSNNADFGIFNQNLSDEILDLTSPYDLFKVTVLKLGYTNNGSEEIFIRGALIDDPGAAVPELQSIVTWLTLATAGSCVCWRRRRRGTSSPS